MAARSLLSAPASAPVAVRTLAPAPAPAIAPQALATPQGAAPVAARPASGPRTDPDPSGIPRLLTREQCLARAEKAMEAKTLFQIANDLKEMEIHAKIDEADVGELRPGQAATFTVDPTQIFLSNRTGSVLLTLHN